METMGLSSVNWFDGTGGVRFGEVAMVAGEFSAFNQLEEPSQNPSDSRWLVPSGFEIPDVIQAFGSNASPRKSAWYHSRGIATRSDCVSGENDSEVKARLSSHNRKPGWNGERATFLVVQSGLIPTLGKYDRDTTSYLLWVDGPGPFGITEPEELRAALDQIREVKGNVWVEIGLENSTDGDQIRGLERYANATGSRGPKAFFSNLRSPGSFDLVQDLKERGNPVALGCRLDILSPRGGSSGGWSSGDFARAAIAEGAIDALVCPGGIPQSWRSAESTGLPLSRCLVLSTSRLAPFFGDVSTSQLGVGSKANFALVSPDGEIIQLYCRGRELGSSDPV